MWVRLPLGVLRRGQWCPCKEVNVEGQKPTGIMLLRNFFGFKEGQTLKEFKAEIDQLSAQEKAELVEMIERREQAA